MLEFALDTPYESSWPEQGRPIYIHTHTHTHTNVCVCVCVYIYTCIHICHASRRLTTGIRTEKCVVRRFRRCVSVIECTYTNLDSTV